MQYNKYKDAYIRLPLNSNLFEMIENNPKNKLLLEALEKAGFFVKLEEDYLLISASNLNLNRGAGAREKLVLLKDSEKPITYEHVLKMLEEMSDQEVMDSFLVLDGNFKKKPISRATYYRRKKRMMEQLSLVGVVAKTFLF